MNFAQAMNQRKQKSDQTQQKAQPAQGQPMQQTADDLKKKRQNYFKKP